MSLTCCPPCLNWTWWHFVPRLPQQTARHGCHNRQLDILLLPQSLTRKERHLKRLNTRKMSATFCPSCQTELDDTLLQGVYKRQTYFFSHFFSTEQTNNISCFVATCTESWVSGCALSTWGSGLFLPVYRAKFNRPGLTLHRNIVPRSYVFDDHTFAGKC